MIRGMISSFTAAVLAPLTALAFATAGVPAEHTPPPDSAPPPARPAPPPLPGPPEDVVRQSATDSPSQRQHTLDYWTPQRMAAAVPLAHLLDQAAEPVPPRLPHPPGAAAPDSTGSRWTGGGRVAATTGRVFLTMGGEDYTCSASVITAENRDTVLTAGHCLKDGQGPWASNWMFVPGYDNGARPYGRYTARTMLVSAQWSRKSDDSYDFGLAVLGTDLAGRHVADRTGAQPIAFTDRVADQVYAFGYPSEPPYRGRHLHYCSGRTSPDPGGTSGAGMRCTMTQGSSGGPWFADFDPAAGVGTITSVVSFKYANDASVQYGPRLGAEAKRVYDTAQRL